VSKLLLPHSEAVTALIY